MAKPTYRAMRSHPKNRKKIRVVDESQLSSEAPGESSSSVVLTIGERLLGLAQALPLPPKKGPGRPRKNVQPVTRQQLRYRQRMLEKAQEAVSKEAARGVARKSGKAPSVAQLASEVWSEVTDGQGVVLVDGRPVEGGEHQS